jgi:hypothetical protein
VQDNYNDRSEYINKKRRNSNIGNIKKRSKRLSLVVFEMKVSQLCLEEGYPRLLILKEIIFADVSKTLSKEVLVEAHKS